MAGVLLQSKFVTGTGAGTAVAADQNTLAGSAIVVFALDVSQTTTFAISDTQGNTYNLTTSRNGGLSTSIAAWVANSKGGANTVTVTSTVGADTIGVMVAEVSGVTAMSGSLNYPANASNNSNQTNPGTGANAITGSATTNSSTFQLGLACYESAPASNTIAAGTGFTSTASGNIHISGWSGMGLGAAPALLEWKSGVAAGAQTVTFTDATNGAANHYWDIFVCLDDFSSVGDNLTPGSTSDLISYNGANWTYVSPATTNWIQATASGADCSTNSGGHPATAFYGTQGSYTADQQAQFVFVSGVAGAPGGVALRLTAGASGPTGYGAWVTATNYNIVLFNNGAVSTLIAGPLNRTNNPGDIFLFQVQGTTLTLSVNGVTLKTLTDSTVSSGNPGIALNGQHPSSVFSTFRAGSLGNNLTGQTVTSVIGQVGDSLTYVPGAQTASFASGSLTDSLAVTLGSQTVTFFEGNLLNVIPLTGQTATFTEGTITASTSANVTLTLGAQSAGFVEGQLADGIGYLLDQGTVILVGQTATFTLGAISASYSPNVPAFTITSVEGSLATSGLSLTLGATSATFLEGQITANAGSNVANTFSSQAINSSEGALRLEIDYFPSALTVTLVEGTVSFSKTGDFAVLLGAQTANLIEGLLNTGPPGTGPPLFIPPQLGKPVTTRTFSWLEMASRAWGSEFRAPDHRIYQFSGGNYKDSTDMGTTGIYSPNLGIPDNP